ncbi:MAG: antibiotic biosynthesis monooxygenase [Bacteroidota bacterium]
MKPPYYAVIFTSIKSDFDEGYAEMAEKMEVLAKQQPGFLGVESARNEVGITVSYWKDLESIKNWKQDLDHIDAQIQGRTKWYEKYTVRIALVEREYSF